MHTKIRKASEELHRIVPNTAADPVLNMIDAARAYADKHSARFESKLADDYVLGPAFFEIIKGIRMLLNGEMVADAGSCDQLIRNLAVAHGYNADDL